MNKIKVQGIEYEYEIEGVFDDEWALKITKYFSETGCTVLHRGIYSSRPDDRYIQYIIEQILKTR